MSRVHVRTLDTSLTIERWMDWTVEWLHFEPHIHRVEALYKGLIV